MVTKKSLSTFRLAYRIFGSTVIMAAISAILFLTSDVITSNFWVNVIISALLIVIYCTMCYNDAFTCGMGDVLPTAKRKPYAAKGAVAGASVYIIPVILLFMNAEPYKLWYGFYMMPFRGVFTIFNNSIYVNAAALLIIPIVCGVGYYNGTKHNDIFERLRTFKNKVVYEEKKHR